MPNSKSPIDLTCMAWLLGKIPTQAEREPTQAKWEHLNSTQKSLSQPVDSNPEPFCCKAKVHNHPLLFRPLFFLSLICFMLCFNADTFQWKHQGQLLPKDTLTCRQEELRMKPTSQSIDDLFYLLSHSCSNICTTNKKSWNECRAASHNMRCLFEFWAKR